MEVKRRMLFIAPNDHSGMQPESPDFLRAGTNDDLETLTQFSGS